MLKKKIKKSIAYTAVMAMMLVFSGCQSSEQTSKNEDYTINLGYYNCDHMVPAVIGEDAGIYDELGLNVKLSGNGKVPQAMSAGQMDAGYIGFRGLVRSSEKGAPIKVGANNHDGGSYYLVVSNDVNTPQDLIGQPLGIGSEPENDMTWRAMAKELGIPAEGINYKGLNFNSDQDAFLALKTGKIKGYACCDPWGSMAINDGCGKIMATYMKPNDNFGLCCALSFNEGFLKEHKDLAVKLLKAHQKSVEYLYTHPIKSAKIFAKYYNVPEEVALMTVYKKTVEEGRTISWQIKPENIKNELSVGIEGGDYSKDVKYEDVVDTDIYKSAKLDDFDEFIKKNVDDIYPVGMSYDDWKNKALKLDK